jgi:hypothetical protein
LCLDEPKSIVLNPLRGSLPAAAERTMFSFEFPIIPLKGWYCKEKRKSKWILGLAVTIQSRGERALNQRKR